MRSICTLRTMLGRGLELCPDKTALIERERQFSFRELSDRAGRMGNALLGLGLSKGDRVAILSRNSMENAESYFSIPNAGLVLVMLNFRLAPQEVLTILTDARTSALIVNEEYVGLVEQIRENLTFVKHTIFIGPGEKTPEGWLHYEAMIEGAASSVPDVDVTDEDLAALMYTSGTTGVPKGCMATHGNFYHVGRSLTLELKIGPQDVGIIPTPLFHASGETVLMSGVFGCIPTIIMPRWDAEEFTSLVEKHQVTLGMLATPMLLFLLDYPGADSHRLRSLRKVTFAGAPVTPIVFSKAIERFGNIFVHLYGTTETVGQATILRIEDVARALANGSTEILGSCGKSFTDMQCQVVDDFDRPVSPGEVGEVRIRGLGTTLGYWSKEQETRKDFRNGWFYPQDLCRVDERGFMYVVGRKKDMIITGGENVYPAEVENVLYRHNAISQAAVIGTDDAKWGEVVTAFVVRKADSELNENDLRSFCREAIAGYKVPKKVIFVDSLPLSASGKLLKSRLKERFS